MSELKDIVEKYILEKTKPYWAFEELNPVQKKTLVEVLTKLRHSQNIVVSAPTGSGKSGLLVTLCNSIMSLELEKMNKRGRLAVMKFLNSPHNSHSLLALPEAQATCLANFQTKNFKPSENIKNSLYSPTLIIVPRKELQDQYEKDFGGKPDLHLFSLKGRSSYPCIATNNTETADKCPLFSAAFRKISENVSVRPTCSESTCEFRKAVTRYDNSNIGVTSLAYYATRIRITEHVNFYILSQMFDGKLHGSVVTSGAISDYISTSSPYIDERRYGHLTKNSLIGITTQNSDKFEQLIRRNIYANYSPATGNLLQEITPTTTHHSDFNLDQILYDRHLLAAVDKTSYSDLRMRAEAAIRGSVKTLASNIVCFDEAHLLPNMLRELSGLELDFNHLVNISKHETIASIIEGMQEQNAIEFNMQIILSMLFNMIVNTESENCSNEEFHKIGLCFIENAPELNAKLRDLIEEGKHSGSEILRALIEGIKDLLELDTMDFPRSMTSYKPRLRNIFIQGIEKIEKTINANLEKCSLALSSLLQYIFKANRTISTEEFFNEIAEFFEAHSHIVDELYSWLFVNVDTAYGTNHWRRNITKLMPQSSQLTNKSSSDANKVLGMLDVPGPDVLVQANALVHIEKNPTLSFNMFILLKELFKNHEKKAIAKRYIYDNLRKIPDILGSYYINSLTIRDKRITLNVQTATYAWKIIENFTGSRVLTSATVNKDSLTQELGLNPTRTTLVSVDNTVKISNRPLIYLGNKNTNMSAKVKEENFPNVIKLVENIANFHCEWRGIIHTVSSNNAIELQKHFRDNPRFLFHIRGDKKHFIEELSKSTNGILVSPSLAEGFDGTGDLARWQIILKIPFPPVTSDLYLAKQKESKKEADKWYLEETMNGLAQMYGRVTRGVSDLGVTYITDGGLDQLLTRIRSLKIESLISPGLIEAISKANSFVYLPDLKFPVLEGSPRALKSSVRLRPSEVFLKPL